MWGTVYCSTVWAGIWSGRVGRLESFISATSSFLSSFPVLALALASVGTLGSFPVFLVISELETSLLIVVIVDRVSLDTSQLLCQLVKQRLDVLASLRRRLEEEQVHLLGILLALFERNLASITHVRLVTGEDKEHVVVAQGPRILNPLLYGLERLARGHIVAHDCHGAVLNVRRDQTFKSLLARSVPKVENDDLVLDVHLLRHEVDADGGLVSLVERVVDEPVDDRSFAHGLVSEEHDLILVLADTARVVCC